MIRRILRPKLVHSAFKVASAKPARCFALSAARRSDADANVVTKKESKNTDINFHDTREFKPATATRAAVDLIAEIPPQVVKKGHVGICDGGGGALGHPKVYINVDKPGTQSCTYCGIRFIAESSEH